MLKIFVCCVMAASLIGCATMESLDGFYEEIKWDDGISRNEAALIAKKWLVESEYAGEFQVWGPKVQGAGNLWQVTFLYKSLKTYEKVLDVYVDTTSGEVKETSVHEKLKPTMWADGKY